MNTKNILSAFDTEAMCEDGEWMHLVVPGTGERAYADPDKKKPLRIKLKGPESDTWTTFFRKARQVAGEKDTRTNDEVKLSDSRLMARMTLAVENIPGVDKSDKESIVSMYRNYQDIRSQALDFISKRENFIVKPVAD